VAAFVGVEQNQNGGRCHGNQVAKNVKFTSNFTKFCSNISCHMLNEISQKNRNPTAAKFVQPIPIFFVLSRSTSCGCCSYQVSSISVWRVTCYDHFYVFQFFRILAISMATAAILKKSTLHSTTSHGI
jgi:hypothetical protein